MCFRHTSDKDEAKLRLRDLIEIFDVALRIGFRLRISTKLRARMAERCKWSILHRL